MLRFVKAAFAFAFASFSMASLATGQFDFNADGKADVLLKNADGRVTVWMMDGSTPRPAPQSKDVAPAGNVWVPTTGGDFYGTCKSGILWQHPDGRTAIWGMDGSDQVSAQSALLLAAGTGWTAKLVGDFDGDGMEDILWTHTDGRVALWLMNGKTQVGGGVLLPAGTGWTPKLVGDFNGDGKADIVWEHTDGRVAMWLMNGKTQVGGGILIPAGTGWHPKFLGDFNGDGKADILWENNDQSSALWIMDGFTQVGGGRLFGAGTGWLSAGTADVNGDRKDDILWRKTDGSVAYWIMNGSVQVGGALVNGASAYSVTGIGHYLGNVATPVNSAALSQWLQQSSADGSIRYYTAPSGTNATLFSTEVLAATPGWSVVNTTSNRACAGAAGGRPFLWLSDSTTKARLLKAAQTNSSEWVTLRNFCNSNQLPDFDYQGDQNYRYAANFSLCYRVSKLAGNDAQADIYAQKAIAVLQNQAYPFLSFTTYNTDSGYGIRNYVPGMALIYDWLNDSPRLDAGTKAAIRAQIKNWLDFYAASGYSNTAAISNYNSGYLVSNALAAIALAGEDANSPGIMAGALSQYNANRSVIDTEMPGGHWAEGWNYGPGVYQAYLMAASAFKVYSGDPTLVNGFNWLSNNVTAKMNMLTPDGRWFYDDGLWSGNGWGDPRAQDMIVAGFAYGWNSNNGRIVKAYTDRLTANQILLADAEWKALLFYDPTATAIDLNTLPKSYQAAGLGMVAMRSDWISNTGSWGTLRVGPYISYQGEQDEDAGHITLYNTTPLLVDAGHDFYGNFYIDNTIYHNTITMENRTDNAYSGQRNFSGQCRNPLGNDPIGINAYIEGGTYTFSSGEFSAAYQNYPVYPSNCGQLPVTWTNRNMLYVRPGLFVVYDQVQKAANQPTVVPTLHFHFATATSALTGDNRRLQMDSGSGRLQLMTVLPPVTTSTVTPEVRDTVNGPGQPNYHLRVSFPTTAGLTNNFLNVFRVGQSNGSYVIPTTSAVTATNAAGVLVTGLLPAESDLPVVAVFAETNTRTIPATLTYSFQLPGSARHYLSKLKPNTNYIVSGASVAGTTTVTVTENTGGTSTTNAAGVLVFVQ